MYNQYNLFNPLFPDGTCTSRAKNEGHAVLQHTVTHFSELKSVKQQSVDYLMLIFWFHNASRSLANVNKKLGAEFLNFKAS